jgi:hypothetical protein
VKVIVAGSRSIVDYGIVADAIESSGFAAGDVEIVSGGAAGVDRLGEEWASRNGKRWRRFPADWFTHGRRAGPLRNLAMAKYADALVAVWDGESRGTKHMLTAASALGLRIHVHRTDRRAAAARESKGEA